MKDSIENPQEDILTAEDHKRLDLEQETVERNVRFAELSEAGELKQIKKDDIELDTL